MAADFVGGHSVALEVGRHLEADWVGRASGWAGRRSLVHRSGCESCSGLGMSERVGDCSSTLRLGCGNCSCLIMGWLVNIGLDQEVDIRYHLGHGLSWQIQSTSRSLSESAAGWSSVVWHSPRGGARSYAGAPPSWCVGGGGSPVRGEEVEVQVELKKRFCRGD